MMIWLMINLAPAIIGRQISGLGLWVQMLEMHKAWVTMNFHKVLIAMRMLCLAMQFMHKPSTC